MEGGLLADGNYATVMQICYLDDATFDEYAESCGLDPSVFHDASMPRAIGIAKAYGNDGSTYNLFQTFATTGTMDVIAAPTYLDRYPTYIGFGEAIDAEGATLCELIPTVSTGDSSLERKHLTMNDIDYTPVGLDIVALAEEAPAIAGGNGSTPKVLVPMSLASTHSFGMEDPVFKSAFNSLDGDHAALADAINAKEDECFSDESPFDIAFVSYNDTIEEMDTTQMMATIVNVFCLLFTVILTLIALANVFNTVTNSFILRKREFAVMRSIGLSNKQFRRMITNECISFGIAGLIPGLLVSAVISYALYSIVGQSMSGLAFTFPWGYVGIAIVLTAVAMGISVAYGMHRCRADNVVEALRADGV